MILIVVDCFTQKEGCRREMAIIHRKSTGRSYEWIFTRFRANGTEGFTVGSSEQRATEFIEMVAKADCAEVFIQQGDFTDLALQAARAITFKSGDHTVDLTRKDETIEVPILE